MSNRNVTLSVGLRMRAPDVVANVPLITVAPVVVVVAFDALTPPHL